MPSTTEAAMDSKLTSEELASGYRMMRAIREFEHRVDRHFTLGDVPGFVHVYTGQEAIAAGVCSVLRTDDYIASTHRGHGHVLAKGCDPSGMMAEIWGRATGLCKGKGGSMHIADLDYGVLGANGVVGAGLPLVVGAGLSARVRGTDQVAVAFFGEGATNEGAFAESLNLASVWKTPCVFVCENNGYAESTGVEFALAGVEPVTRAAAYAMPGIQVDGNDFFAVREATLHAVERARAGDGPSLIECKAIRWGGHYVGDGEKYRGPDEIAGLKRDHDCLVQFREAVTSAGLMTEDELQGIDNDVVALLDEVVRAAAEAPQPSATSLLTDVYASY